MRFRQVFHLWLREFRTGAGVGCAADTSQRLDVSGQRRPISVGRASWSSCPISVHLVRRRARLYCGVRARLSSCPFSVQLVRRRARLYGGVRARLSSCPVSVQLVRRRARLYCGVRARLSFCPVSVQLVRRRARLYCGVRARLFSCPVSVQLSGGWPSRELSAAAGHYPSFDASSAATQRHLHADMASRHGACLRRSDLRRTSFEAGTYTISPVRP